MAWYYITILFNDVSLTQVVQFISIYSLWIVFVVTVILAFSAIFSTGVAATLALLVTLVFQFIDALIGKYRIMSPWKLSTYATYAFNENADDSSMWLSAFVTILLIIILMVFGILVAKRNAAKTTV